MHDFRARGRSLTTADIIDRVDSSPAQPTPLSILHLPRPGDESLLTDDIYVAGRSTGILHYDRRKITAPVCSIYSGASLSSLACLPYPFSAPDSELRRNGGLSISQIQQFKAQGVCTLIACGEYNTKGSLELYGLQPGKASHSFNGRVAQQSIMKNRQTSAHSKILIAIIHGTRLALSDSSGNIKWFERDGLTEVRRHRIGYGDVAHQSSILSTGSDDLAQKILSTAASSDAAAFNNGDIPKDTIPEQDGRAA